MRLSMAYLLSLLQKYKYFHQKNTWLIFFRNNHIKSHAKKVNVKLDSCTIIASDFVLNDYNLVALENKDWFKFIIQFHFPFPFEFLPLYLN